MVSNSVDRLNGVVASIAVKAPVKAVATSNLTLNGLQTVGGVVLAEGDRVLCIAQTSAVDNGIYCASTSDWPRAPDFDGNRDVTTGTLVTVEATVGSDVFYQASSPDDPINIGTSEINFVVVNNPNVSYPTTDDEVTAGVTVVNDSYPEMHLLRYGTNTTPGTTDMSTALQAAADVGDTKGGGCLQLPAEIIRLDTGVTIYGGTKLQGCGFGMSFNTFAGNTGTLIRCGSAMNDLIITDENSSGAFGHAQIADVLLDGANLADVVLSMRGIRDSAESVGIVRGAVTGLENDVTGVAEQRLRDVFITMDSRGTGWHILSGSDSSYMNVIVHGAEKALLVENGGHEFSHIHLYPSPLDPADTDYRYLLKIRSTGDNYFSNCHFDNVRSVGSVLTINDATSANPIVFTTSTAHGLADGEYVRLKALPGDFGTNLNDNLYRVTVLTTTTFSIDEDGSGYTAYTTGGTCQRISTQVIIDTDGSSALENVFVNCSWDNPGLDIDGEVPGVVLDASPGSNLWITAYFVNCCFSAATSFKYHACFEKEAARAGQVIYSVLGGQANNADAMWTHRPQSSHGFTWRDGGFTLIPGGGPTISEGPLSTTSGGELTISGGVITATGSHHRVDTQADAGTDDLDTINGGYDGMILVLQAQDSTRDVVVKDGTGNLVLNGDFTMVEDTATIMLQYHLAQAEWVELGRSGVAGTVAYTPTNVTPTRTYDADATSIAELGDVLGTLIADLQDRGIVQ